MLLARILIILLWKFLEVNQIICYFNYVNRLVNGLGVTTKNDTVGYYTGSDSVDMGAKQ